MRQTIVSAVPTCPGKGDPLFPSSLNHTPPNEQKLLAESARTKVEDITIQVVTDSVDRENRLPAGCAINRKKRGSPARFREDGGRRPCALNH